MDITQEREAEEAQGSEQSSEEGPKRSDLAPEQEAWQQESDARIAAALAELEKLSRKLPGDNVFRPPPHTHMLATMQVVVNVMIERGILSPTELELRAGRAFAEILEGTVRQAAEQAKDAEIWTPDKAGAGAPPPPPNALRAK